MVFFVLSLSKSYLCSQNYTFMKNSFISWAVFALVFCTSCMFSSCSQRLKPDENCVVLASFDVRDDCEWNKVALDVQTRHRADLFYFHSHPEECEEQLRMIFPRYVIVVDKPQNIDPDYIMKTNKLSRRIDEDVFADFLWGIITGYDAASAALMEENSVEPLVIHDCVSDIMELQSAKWFDNYAWVDDHTKGLAGEKHGFDSPVVTYQFDFEDELNIFSNFLRDVDPDLVVTATHANYDLLTVPFMPAGKCKLVSDSGYVWKEFDGKKIEKVPFSGKRNVYFPVGNCLIAGMNSNVHSMPPAWIHHAHSAAMVGYVVPTWYGRNGWGGLKYWLTFPGRYTLPEAIYLNQQDMLAQMNEWDESFASLDYPFQRTEQEQNEDSLLNDFGLAEKRIKEVTSLDSVTMHHIGFLHDRDVLAYYGDPLWDVRLQPLEEEQDYTVDLKEKDDEVVLTIATNDNFSLTRLKGDHFKEEHVLDLPFSYFFPRRLQNPRLADPARWNAVLDENFLLLYDPDFEPGKKYEIHIIVDSK